MQNPQEDLAPEDLVSVASSSEPTEPTLLVTCNTGDDKIDPFLLSALNNPRDRLLLLKLDHELERFVNDLTKQRLEFPPMSSYQRLIVHRVAQYFLLDHAAVDVDNLKRAVVLFKSPQSRVPVLRLTDLREEPDAPPQKAVKIMRRASNVPARYANSAGGAGERAASDKTLEERETEYAKARARIFNESPEKLANSDTNPSVITPIPSSSPSTSSPLPSASDSASTPYTSTTDSLKSEVDETGESFEARVENAKHSASRSRRSFPLVGSPHDPPSPSSSLYSTLLDNTHPLYSSSPLYSTPPEAVATGLYTPPTKSLDLGDNGFSVGDIDGKDRLPYQFDADGMFSGPIDSYLPAQMRFDGYEFADYPAQELPNWVMPSHHPNFYGFSRGDSTYGDTGAKGNSSFYFDFAPVSGKAWSQGSGGLTLNSPMSANAAPFEPSRLHAATPPSAPTPATPSPVGSTGPTTGPTPGPTTGPTPGPAPGPTPSPTGPTATSPPPTPSIINTSNTINTFNTINTYNTINTINTINIITANSNSNNNNNSNSNNSNTASAAANTSTPSTNSTTPTSGTTSTPLTPPTTPTSTSPTTDPSAAPSPSLSTPSSSRPTKLSTSGSNPGSAISVPPTTPSTSTPSASRKHITSPIVPTPPATAVGSVPSPPNSTAPPSLSKSASPNSKPPAQKGGSRTTPHHTSPPPAHYSQHRNSVSPPKYPPAPIPPSNYFNTLRTNTSPPHSQPPAAQQLPLPTQIPMPPPMYRPFPNQFGLDGTWNPYVFPAAPQFPPLAHALSHLAQPHALPLPHMYTHPQFLQPQQNLFGNALYAHQFLQHVPVQKPMASLDYERRPPKSTELFDPKAPQPMKRTPSSQVESGIRNLSFYPNNSPQNSPSQPHSSQTTQQGVKKSAAPKPQKSTQQQTPPLQKSGSQRSSSTQQQTPQQNASPQPTQSATQQPQIATQQTAAQQAATQSTTTQQQEQQVNTTQQQQQQQSQPFPRLLYDYPQQQGVYVPPDHTPPPAVAHILEVYDLPVPPLATESPVFADLKKAGASIKLLDSAVFIAIFRNAAAARKALEQWEEDRRGGAYCGYGLRQWVPAFLSVTPGAQPTPSLSEAEINL